MKDAAEQLVVRRHERRECRVPATVRIGDADSARVALSRSAGDGSGALAATMVDVSQGGLGLESSVFLPRGVRVVVGVRLGGGLIELPCRVQRVLMNSRAPTFYLGLAFTASPAERGAMAERLLAALDSADKPDAAGSGGARA